MANALTGLGYNIGIKAQEGDHEGTLPSLITLAWENTEDIRALNALFTVHKGAMAISEAQCITHKVGLLSKLHLVAKEI